MRSLYRRHRPRTFDQVVGQEHVVRTLRNAVSGVDEGKVHHAYLFVGSRGTGKTSMAKILASCLNCERGPTTEPCGECEACVAIAAGTSMDVIEMDAASHNSIEDIRELRERVGYLPAQGRWKVYILDEAHMLSTAAWNAFLKTLEEPPPHTLFVLATTESHKVLPTIVDRCQRFDFRRPALAEVTEVLRRIATEEGVEVPDAALDMIGRAGQGSFRDAIGTLDQLITLGGDSVSMDDVLTVLGVTDAERVFAVTDTVAAHDPRAALLAVGELADSGADLGQFMRDLMAHLRHLVVVQAVGEVPESFSVTAEQTDRLRAQAGALAQEEAVRGIDLLGEALAAAKDGSDPRIQLELALLKAARPESDAGVGGLQARVARLEAGLDGEVETKAEAAPAPESEPDPEPQAVPDPEPAAAADPEPQPQPQADPVAPTAAGFEQVAELWTPVLEALKRSEGGHRLATLLAETRPVGLDGDRLRVAFPREQAFLRHKAEEPERRGEVERAVEAVVGRRFVLAFELAAAGGAPEAPPEDAVLSEEEAVAHLKEAFDAEELPGAEAGAE